MKLGRSERCMNTLRRRLLLVLILPLTTLLFISVVVYYHIAFEPAADAYDHALADDAVALAERVRFQDSGLLVDLPPAAEEVLRTNLGDQEFLAIYAPDGKLLVGDPDLLPDPPIGGRNPVLGDAWFRGKKIRKASYRVKTPVGLVAIIVAETTWKREDTGAKILAAMILPNILLILATLALVFFGVRSGLAPLTQLSEAIGRRKAHDLSPLPSGVVPGEVEPLIKAIDGLIGDLRSAAIAQQEFLANAAHQLKTPLATLQAQLELHVSELPKEYQNRANRLLGATQRLGRLTHQFLAIARSGPDAYISQERRAVDLGSLLESGASGWFDFALANQIDLGFEIESAVVNGTEWLLRELIANLIDNALRYTPAGGTVTARSGIDSDNNPFIEVEDSGPGIPEGERELVFERYYRTSDTRGTGTGLGLAIVKEVADRHDAKIILCGATPSGGTRVRVVFRPF